MTRGDNLTMRLEMSRRWALARPTMDEVPPLEELNWSFNVRGTERLQERKRNGGR